MQSNRSTLHTFARFAPGRPAPALALALRDALLAARDARDFSGADAVHCARDLYWLLLVAAVLPRPQVEQPTPPAAPARSIAVLVPSERNPKLVYIVRGYGRSCTCPGFTHRGQCKHSRQAREQRQQHIRDLIVAARARIAA